MMILPHRTTYKKFIIGKGFTGWYVCEEDSGKMDENGDPKESYLHKDLTLHPFCGRENFYDTVGAAMQAIDALAFKKNEHEFIQEEEFSP